MKVVVFTGPTLSAEEARVQIDASFLPPVSEGDVYRAVCQRPKAIAIIDGYFNVVPAVWHKEILWAMSQGIHVFGSASMGALRAAELAAFGMEGVGSIYEAYREGQLEDDDEVAVAHLPAAYGYKCTSTAMVDIRATLVAAQAEGVISATARVSLEHFAKVLFYDERNYGRLLQVAEQNGLDAGELKSLAEWLPHGERHQKRDDALQMLRVIQERSAAGMKPKQVSYNFEYSDRWEHARRNAVHDEQDLRPGSIVEELRLEGPAYAQAQRGALARYFAIQESWNSGLGPKTRVLSRTLAELRCKHGLGDPGLRQRWLQQNQLSEEELSRFLEEEARLQWVEATFSAEVEQHLPDHLRASGEYARLAARAADKQNKLNARGLQNPSLADAGISDDELLRWYFERCLGLPVTPRVSAYCRQLGFKDVATFRRALLREYCYRNC